MKYRFGTRVISFLLCIAMVLGLKLELPVNARADGDDDDSNDIRRIWYVGDTINLAEVLPSGALVMWYDFKNVEIAVPLYNVYPWDTVVKRAVQAKALTEDVWVFDELYRYSESTTALQSALVNRIPNRPEPVGFTIVGPKTTDDGKVYYTFDALDYHYHNASGFEAWYEYDKLPDISGAGVKFFLTGDVYLTSTWNVPNGTTSLCLNGHSIYLKGDGDVIRVNKGSRLYIYDEEGEDRGTPGAIAHVGGVGNGVRVEGGHFGLYSGTIAGNTRGVYMKGGSFTMEGGSIDHNTVQDGHGGGVCIDGGGKFEMKGGTIEKNTVKAGNGGGVYLNGGDEIDITGGTISGNTVQTGNGGGVYLNGGDEINITGGTISGNTVQTGNGGGVYMNGCGFDMTDVTISGNTVHSGDGGGICIDGNGSIIIYKDVAIAGNTVHSGNGGGVCINGGGEVRMFDDSAVRSNIAENGNGGGVYVGASSSFHIVDNPIIEKNSVGKTGGDECNGGGVFVSYKGIVYMLTKENGGIVDNWSEGGNGGGVYVDGKFHYMYGKVTNNITKTPDDEKDNNAYITKRGVVELLDQGDDDHEFGVSMQMPGVFTKKAQEKGALESWFNSDDTNYTVGWEGNELALLCKIHDYVYEANGNAITGHCTRCGVTNTLLVISEPAHKKYGDEEDANATVDAYFDEEEPPVSYQTWNNGKYGPKTETAPTDAGQHKASITAHGVTAFVEYVVAKAENSLSYRGLTVDRTYSLSGQTAGLRSATKAEGAVSYEIVSQREKSVIFDIIIKAIKWAIETYLKGKEPKDPEKFAEDVGKEVLEALLGGGGIDQIKDILLEKFTGLSPEDILNIVNYLLGLLESAANVDYFALNGTTLTIAPCTPAGTYSVEVRATAQGDSNHESGSKTASVTVNIDKAESAPAAVVAIHSTYDGSDKPLVSVTGVATGGTMLYASESGGFSESIPTGIEAGTYNVSYMVAGDDNHKDFGPASVQATIAKANASAVAPTALKLVYNGSAQALVAAGQTDDGTMEYAPGTPEGASGPYSSAIPTGANAGDYVVWYRVKGDDNHKNSEAEAVGA